MGKRNKQLLQEFIEMMYNTKVNFSRTHKGSFWFEINGEKYEYFKSQNRIYGDVTRNSPEKWAVEDTVNDFIQSLKSSL